jgi:hypothetical protein
MISPDASTAIYGHFHRDAELFHHFYTAIQFRDLSIDVCITLFIKLSLSEAVSPFVNLTYTSAVSRQESLIFKSGSRRELVELEFDVGYVLIQTYRPANSIFGFPR